MELQHDMASLSQVSNVVTLNSTSLLEFHLLLPLTLIPFFSLPRLSLTVRPDYPLSFTANHFSLKGDHLQLLSPVTLSPIPSKWVSMSFSASSLKSSNSLVRTILWRNYCCCCCYYCCCCCFLSFEDLKLFFAMNALLFFTWFL